MYIARLKLGETIQLGDDIFITVRRESRGNKTWVEVTAPREKTITKLTEAVQQKVHHKADFG